MADQQNIVPPEQDHLVVARNLLDGRGDAGYDAVQCHALIDIAESLRHLRPDVALLSHARALDELHTVEIAEDDWESVYQALIQVAATLGRPLPAGLLAELRTAFHPV